MKKKLTSLFSFNIRLAQDLKIRGYSSVRDESQHVVANILDFNVIVEKQLRNGGILRRISLSAYHWRTILSL